MAVFGTVCLVYFICTIMVMLYLLIVSGKKIDSLGFVIIIGISFLWFVWGSYSIYEYFKTMRKNE